ncbi:MAG TPA: hypothetical protein IAA46_07075 [Candidatus Gemmiger avium]|nr:hypothetical protein [Candidatus Gemmiger avium]
MLFATKKELSDRVVRMGKKLHYPMGMKRYSQKRHILFVNIGQTPAKARKMLTFCTERTAKQEEKRA